MTVDPLIVATLLGALLTVLVGLHAWTLMAIYNLTRKVAVLSIRLESCQMIHGMKIPEEPK